MRDWKFKTFVSWTLSILSSCLFIVVSRTTDLPTRILILFVAFWGAASIYYVIAGIIWQEKEDKKK